MIRRLMGATAVGLSFLGGFAAFGGGPMSPTRPMPAYEAAKSSSDKVAEAAVPPAQVMDPASLAEMAPPAPRQPVAAIPGQSKEQKPVAAIPGQSKEQKPVAAQGATDKKQTAEAQPSPKKRRAQERPQETATTRSNAPADPDHMAATLNRMQLQGRSTSGYGGSSAPYRSGFGAAPYSAGN